MSQEEKNVNFLSAIERPLSFYEDEKKTKVQGPEALSIHIRKTCRSALASSINEEEKRVFRLVQELFSGFEDLSEKEQLSRVRKAFTITRVKPADPEIRYFQREEYASISLKEIKASQKKLDGKVQFVKGVGPALGERLGRVGIKNVGDLLNHFPSRYEDRRQIQKIGQLHEGEKATVIGEVEFSGVAYYRGLRRKIFEVIVKDGTGELKLKWFQFSHGSLEDRIQKTHKIIVCGKVKKFRSRMEMHHPDFEVFKGDLDSISFGRIVPVYREVGGIYQKTIRRILHNAVAHFSHFRQGVIPKAIAERHDLTPPWKAVRWIHFPSSLPDPEIRSKAQEVLSFEELFFYCLSLGLQKQSIKKGNGFSFQKSSPRGEKLLGELPFELTEAQKRVLKSIREDMASPHPMNRLLQGDVGSGKTIVAFLAALSAIDHGRQVAFMAPTEILAEQHMHTLKQWALSVDVKIESLLGKQKPAQKQETIQRLKEGKIDVLVGTHALLEKGVEFQALGLVVVDEQHRFGVRQRAVLRTKAQEPDVLVMSATPIPRTLALTLYGDLDVSILDELPKGRKPIVSEMVTERGRSKVYAEIKKAVQEGRQAYVVYPLVNPSDRLEARDATTMADELRQNVFPNIRVELIHGQMPGLERELIMKEFHQGKIQLLVSTTVIEVGIDVPNATIMVIEHPERFGLAQLHQLRGRVGRGEERSFCYLICPPKVSKQAKERLNVFVDVHDGFLLAEEDLRVRGPGDFFGTAQSGYPTFKLAVFPRDLDLLEAARREAFSLLERDPDLLEPENKVLHWMVSEVWSERLNLVRIG